MTSTSGRCTRSSSPTCAPDATLRLARSQTGPSMYARYMTRSDPTRALRAGVSFPTRATWFATSWWSMRSSATSVVPCVRLSLGRRVTWTSTLGRFTSAATLPETVDPGAVEATAAGRGGRVTPAAVGTRSTPTTTGGTQGAAAARVVVAAVVAAAVVALEQAALKQGVLGQAALELAALDQVVPIGELMGRPAPRASPAAAAAAHAAVVQTLAAWMAVRTVAAAATAALWMRVPAVEAAAAVAVAPVARAVTAARTPAGASESTASPQAIPYHLKGQQWWA